jgi:hypothetical protein
MIGDQRGVVDVGDPQLVLEALEVGEAQALGLAPRFVPSVPEALLPEVERLGRGDAPADAVDHSRARPAAGRSGELEERQVRAGIALLVGVEEVVDGGLVLVDRLLHEAQTHQAGVEVDVALRLRGDRRDVVDSFELHRCLSFRLEALWHRLGVGSFGREGR